MKPRFLIVNADDFGMHPAVNQGILQAHAHGIVTSTSLMVLRPACDQAVRDAQSHPALALGLHLDLGEWVYRHNEWHPHYLVVNLQDPHAVRAEIQRQIDLFSERVGRLPTHLDSHQHVHRHEPVRSAARDAAERLQIPLRSETLAIQYCGAFYGQSNSGLSQPSRITAGALVEILRDLPGGLTELACHPADQLIPSSYSAERLLELDALCDPAPRAALAEYQIVLCSFATRPTAISPEK
jgi:predicted glycoside hydrolase/deacetylase ChbG (UPF0249 family)